MRRVFPLYALSGFISLGYQVAWFRICIDWFGSTNLTFALVVCNFIGGLGCGALLSRRITRLLTDRTGIGDKLRLYGLIELLVGVAALLTVAVEYLPTDLWGSFPYHLNDEIWVQTIRYQIAQGTIATVSLFIPCLFMGVTFPLLCDIFPLNIEERSPSLHPVCVEHYWCVCWRTRLPVHPDIGDRTQANLLVDGRLEHTAGIVLPSQRWRTC